MDAQKIEQNFYELLWAQVTRGQLTRMTTKNDRHNANRSLLGACGKFLYFQLKEIGSDIAPFFFSV